jgi:hypothetical protein
MAFNNGRFVMGFQDTPSPWHELKREERGGEKGSDEGCDEEREE